MFLLRERADDNGGESYTCGECSPSGSWPTTLLFSPSALSLVLDEKVQRHPVKFLIVHSELAVAHAQRKVLLVLLGADYAGQGVLSRAYVQLVVVQPLDGVADSHDVAARDLGIQVMRLVFDEIRFNGGGPH